MKNRLIFATATIAVMLVGLVQFDTAGAAPKGPSHPSVQATAPSPGMPGMMKMHEQMLAEMKAADARLDALVKDMNAASGDAKVTAIATVVTELATQQKSIHQHMDQMHQQMMSGRGMMMNR
jgi:hypothetical protein